MKSIEQLTIKSSNSKYKVLLKKSYSLDFSKKYVIIFDKNLQDYAAEYKTSDSVLLPVIISEKDKNLETCGKLLKEMAAKNVNKDFEIIAIGGGAIQDIATLVASIYMRGLNWTYIPTTTMSMMDSCIGGKSSINIDNYKNIIGNFYPPSTILIDNKCVKTLDSIGISSGIAEALKICFARGPKYFNDFAISIKNWRAFKTDDYLNESIMLSLDAKKYFIEVDEFDKKERKLLNFGHSFGHALEASTNFAIPHGIGVLLGMQAAILHSKNKEPCSQLTAAIIDEFQLSAFPKTHFVIDKDMFIKALKFDKKNSSDLLRLVLPDRKGRLNLDEFGLTIDSLNAAFESLIESCQMLGADFEVL
jgi:3-dehydroquinate synthase